MTKPKLKDILRRDENDYVPSDYNDLYRYYIIGKGNGNSLANKLIRYYLPYATQDERETLAHDVFMRIFEQGMLARFDPTKANFGGVIFFTVRTICVNHLGRKSRNPLTGLCGGSLTQSDPEDGQFEPGMYNLDRIFPAETKAPEDMMYNRTVIEMLYEEVNELLVRNRHKRDQSLRPLLDMLAKQSTPEECALELGVTTSTIHNWIEVLADMVRDIKKSLRV